MSIKSKILQLLSFFTRSKIQVGYSLSMDDNETIPEFAVTRSLTNVNAIKGSHYVLKDHKEGFEFVGFIKNGDVALYQLKHKATGETFNITKAMLEFLFEKK